ncbi:hypothetical protein XELAEV_18025368mg, partial [Xenopus laevis]
MVSLLNLRSFTSRMSCCNHSIFTSNSRSNIVLDSALLRYSSSMVCSCCFNSFVPVCSCCMVRVIRSKLQRFSIPCHFCRNSLKSAGCSITRRP